MLPAWRGVLVLTYHRVTDEGWDPYDVPRTSAGLLTTPGLLRATITRPRLFARW